ncbi:L,D-transpeptidase-like protein [Krasilnikovia cinnamomea]|uniref:L,D-transpeptidase-like protein n=1 Tax=Krasilnikovia cinnamomea TaxID=349313 RepID=A0A4Q7ZTZ0_9ACTN|nr:L,D-transpeptidase-like protein [Krasilnikovia cinnamomea]
MTLRLREVDRTAASTAVRPAPSTARPGQQPALPARAAPADLPVIDYRSVPGGFPPDPTPQSTAALTEGLRPRARLAVYDAPGGRPRAFLPPSISGVPVTVPILMRRGGWVAVLLPSINRTMGWLPAGRWAVQPLRDHLILRRRTHELTWLRDGALVARWTVTTGSPATPTPLGRSFVLGRSTPGGAVYGGLDALVLGSVPDDRHAVPPALRGAHTGIHSWHRGGSFGKSVSNGCIRVPKSGQRRLLSAIAPGTPVSVVD